MPRSKKIARKSKNKKSYRRKVVRGGGGNWGAAAGLGLAAYLISPKKDKTRNAAIGAASGALLF